MENDILLDISNQFFQEHNKGPREWNFRLFFYGQYIPQKCLENAKKYYAFYDTNTEKPILLYNNTAFRSAKDGFVITNWALYYRLRKRRTKPQIGIINLSEIKKMEIVFDTKYNMGSELFVNGNIIGFLTGYSKGKRFHYHVPLFNELFQMYIDAVQEGS